MTSRIILISFAFFLSFCTTEAQETIKESILHDDLIREYIVYVPDIYDEATPVPLMFNFHGYTGQASWQMDVINMKAVSDTAGFILVCPQGSLFNASTHWNVGSWTNGSTADDLGFTEAVIDTLASKYNIDLDRVYSCGYSNGGYFSFELACQLSNRIAAIGSVGGKMSSKTYNSCNPVHPTPVVTIHGTADNTVSYFGSTPIGSKTISDVNTYWVTYNNTDAVPDLENIPNINTSDGSTVEYYSYKDGDNCTSVDHYKVNGGGHDWPGVWGNKDIDASSVIWNFVSKYDINGLIDCSATYSNEIISKSGELTIYPNPANDIITIEIKSPGDMNCYIYSLSGKLLLSQLISTANNTINVSELLPNIYFMKVGSKTMKLIKTE